jgi:hypothetical protein
MEPVLCLLPSPLTGPATWHPVAQLLTSRGARVVEVPLSRSAPRTSDDVLAWFSAAIPGDEDVVLIPHSNAGLYVPALTTQRRVTGYVFIDAVLPASAGQAPMIPASFYDIIAAKADADGILPPWTAWWEEDISSLFPSAAVREQVEREEPRLPLSYFAGSMTVPSGWDARPGAYLAFGDTYAEEVSDAVARGWPTRSLPGEHLHMLINPAQVADEIAALLEVTALLMRLGLTPIRGPNPLSSAK